MDVSFKQIYIQNISPKLMDIDVFLKTNDAPYNPIEVALVLGMPTEEVTDLMKEHNIKAITLVDFFTIVSHASSYICRLITRQWKYAFSEDYTPEMIAYIYELNLTKVQEAFKLLGKCYIAPHEMLEVFNHIPATIFILDSQTI